MPETSIVIRTFNEERDLGNLLAAIKSQAYRNYEIIIVDSGSTDRTLDIAREHGATVLQIESRDFTFGYSLNVGCKAARGIYIVCASAHVLPTDDSWLSHMIAPFSNEKVAMVYGRQMGHEVSKFSEQQDFKRLFGSEPTNKAMVLDYANNANSAIRKRIWEQHPFDEYLFGLEDIDWARYVVKEGYLVSYAPRAAVYHIHREMWHQVFNRYRREAIAAYRIGLPHPPQARLEFWWLIGRLIHDFVATFPNYSPHRVHEILRFRYYQWKGSRQGWFYDRHLDLDRSKFELFYQSTNRVVAIHSAHHAAIEDRTVPELKPGDVLLEVAYVGMCHTDREVYNGTLGYYAKGVASYPIVPGHEYSGTIVKIGASTKLRERLQVGERVVGECILSRNEHNRTEVGVINHDGAYAKLIVVPGTAIHPIPENVDMKTAVLAEPLAVVLRGLRRVLPRVPEGAPVAVIGAGPIGNLAAQVLTSRGYSVTVFDQNKKRLELVKAHVHAINDEIKDISTFACIVEATGVTEVLEKVLNESRADATLLTMGFPYGPMTYNFEDIVGKEKVIVGSVGSDANDFSEALSVLPDIDTAAFTQTILPLEEFKEAWALLEKGTHFKILLKP